MAKSKHTRLRTLTAVVLSFLILTPVASFAYKVTALDYRISNIIPQTQYKVALRMTLDGGDGRVRVATFAPADDAHQTISEESQSSPQVLHHTIESKGLNRQAIWLGAPTPDGTEIRYEFSALVSAVQFKIADDLGVPESYPRAVRDQLQPTEVIQVDAPEVRALLHRLEADRGPLISRLEAIYEHTEGLGYRSFKGTTDALTALRLG